MKFSRYPFRGFPIAIAVNPPDVKLVKPNFLHPSSKFSMIKINALSF